MKTTFATHHEAVRQARFRRVWEAERRRRLRQLQVGLAIVLVTIAALAAVGLFAGPAMWLVAGR